MKFLGSRDCAATLARHVDAQLVGVKDVLTGAPPAVNFEQYMPHGMELMQGRKARSAPPRPWQ